MLYERAQMTRALLEEPAAPVRTQPRALILILSVQVWQEGEGHRDPVELEPLLPAQMSPVFETEGTAPEGGLQEQDVVEDSIAEEGAQVAVEGCLEREVARLREWLTRRLTDEVAANETVHSEHLMAEVWVH